MSLHRSFRAPVIAFLSLLFICSGLICYDYRMAHAYQNPVNYIDSVDVVQANISGQKFSEWITANAADIDTLETLNQLVFQAVDTTGGQTIAGNDSAFITLDKEVVKASIYVHATDDYAVAVNEDGIYEIFYQVSIDASTSIPMRTSLRWYSSSWQNIPGATMSTLVVSDGGSTSASVIWPLSSGDSIAVFVKSLASVTSLVTEVDGVGLTIKKLY